MKSLKGKLLLAHPSLEDPNFSQSVVLLVRHNQEGALGVILNRPLETSVKEAIGDAVEEPFEVESLLHQGGPCEGLLMVLHTVEYAGEIDVADGLFFSIERDKVEWLLKHQGRDEEVKFFVGYAAWGPGQLENEMKHGSWIVSMPVPQEALFETDEGMWTRLLTAVSLSAWVKPDQIPDDPTLN